jgi:hypothetical protein
MTTPPHPHETDRGRVLTWASLLYVLPGLLILQISFARSIVSNSPTFLSTMNRLGFALVAAWLLLVPAALRALRRVSPLWRAALDERAASAVRHPRWVWRAQWWGGSMGALAFALLALAPDPLSAWLSAESQDAPWTTVALLVFLYLAVAIAGAPLFLLLRLHRPRP